MAGDWIKMRTNLDTDPAVIQMAIELNLTELDIVGRLWKIWSWANEHTISGNDINVTSVTLDRFTNCPGFAAAMRNVGWLEGREGALTFPRFDRHNGQTAKNRALTKDRVAKHRNENVTLEPLPEKRREEKRRVFKPPISPYSEKEIEVLNYLNEKTGAKFCPVNGSLMHLSARFKEGATVEQCKAVIDDRVKAWASDPKMREYLRPQTLFNSEKFPAYLGRIGAQKPIDANGGWK